MLKEDGGPRALVASNQPWPVPPETIDASSEGANLAKCVYVSTYCKGQPLALAQHLKHPVDSLPVILCDTPVADADKVYA